MKKLGDLIMFILFISTFAILILGFVNPNLIKDFIEWMREIVKNLSYWNFLIVFLSSLIEGLPVLGTVVPGQNILLIVGGFFGSESISNLLLLILVSFLGSTISNFFGYFLGYYYGEVFFKKYGLWFGIGETDVKYLKSSIDKWGATGIIIGKFHNLARAFIPFIAGSVGMHKKFFFIYNIIGSLIRSIFMILIGTIFVSYYELILDYLGYIMIGIFILIGLYIYMYKKDSFIIYMKERNEEIQRKF